MCDLDACLWAVLSNRRAVFNMLGARLNTNRNAVGPENPVLAGVHATLRPAQRSVVLKVELYNHRL